METSPSFRDWFYVATNGAEPYAYQERLAGAASLPSVVEVPTGSGKTLAVALTWFYRRFSGRWPETPSRLVYVLPTRSLSDQTRLVLEAVGKRLWEARYLPEPVSVHLLLGDDADDGWTTQVDRPSIVVGTQDMVLSRLLNRGFALPRTRWPMAAGALSHDSWFVWDEVQLMANGLPTALQLSAARSTPHFGVFSPSQDLWMSATVAPESLNTVDHAAPDPASPQWFRLQRSDLETPALQAVVGSRRTLREAPVTGPSGRGSPEKYVRQLAAYIQALPDDWAQAPDPLLLVLVNTVARAQAVHAAVEAWAQKRQYDLALLHSRFRGADRQRLNSWVLSSPPNGARPRVLISTQVVEAGVDLSASHLITELAPWSSMVQRMGRLNRRGRQSGAIAEWVNLEDAAPYQPTHLARSRDWLRQHEGETVTPQVLLTAGPPGSDSGTRLVLRMHDMEELFDTTPELAGADIDVSRYVRDLTEDCDVQVFWRPESTFEGDRAVRWPGAAELCAVSVGRLKELLAARKAHAWQRNGDDLRWQTCTAAQIVPGGTYGLATNVGGYLPTRGFDPLAVDPVPSVFQDYQDSRHTPEGDRVSQWCELERHGVDTRRHLGLLLDQLGTHWAGIERYRGALLLAALLHDRGKASPIFQNAIPNRDDHHPASTLWAKAPAFHRYERPHFRHEAVGALALLEAPPPELDGLAPWERDLVLYLVASHHGRVRLSVRAHRDEVRTGSVNVLGMKDEDHVPAAQFAGVSAPEATLSLEPIRLGENAWGDSWTGRVQALLEELGPLRLLAMETLVRIADWRASAEEAGQ